MLSNDDIKNESKGTNKTGTSGKDEKISINLSEEETTVKSTQSINLSGELISNLNQNDKMDLLMKKSNITVKPEKKERNEITEDELMSDMFKKYYNKYIKNWNYSKLKDESRLEKHYNKSGGIDCTDDKFTALARSTGWELVKQLGKKIISGDFNLTTITIPIKVMYYKTILENLALSVYQYPFYFNLASLQIDPLERFKYVIIATISCFHKTSNFYKPVTISYFLKY